MKIKTRKGTIKTQALLSKKEAKWKIESTYYFKFINLFMLIINKQMHRLVRLSTAFSTQTQQQKIIFIFGPPGVGKGTYAKMLMKDLQLNHISTGD